MYYLRVEGILVKPWFQDPEDWLCINRQRQWTRELQVSIEHLQDVRVLIDFEQRQHLKLSDFNMIFLIWTKANEA